MSRRLGTVSPSRRWRVPSPVLFALAAALAAAALYAAAAVAPPAPRGFQRAGVPLEVQQGITQLSRRVSPANRRLVKKLHADLDAWVRRGLYERKLPPSTGRALPSCLDDPPGSCEARAALGQEDGRDGE